MERPRPSEIAWATIVASIAAYELLAPENELLTNQMHRWLDDERRTVRTGAYAVVGATALHLLRELPTRGDPYTYIGRAGNAVKRKSLTVRKP